ncbi:MAG: alpha/beta hydrolase [Thermofilaceae archaeon]|nr:alpha/beta hydrolase [Thermofilaceae archaeon]MCX8180296.1 alpha/beta hydrolase [Thermofilaceae archaeon]MDW8003831.1 alpha/beta hydrolase [Thermofilaceae archaeon]
MRKGDYEEGHFLDVRGRRFFFRLWKSKRAKAGLILFHALGLHSGRYAWFCDELSSMGMTCLAVDLYGHGLSDGIRGGGSFKELYGSASKFLQLFNSKYRGLRWLIAGHGTSALLALLLSTQLNSTVLAISPLVEVSSYIGSITRLKLLKLLRRKVPVVECPLYDIRHWENTLKIRDDNLVVRKVSASLILEALKTLRSCPPIPTRVVLLSEQTFKDYKGLQYFRSIARNIETEISYDPEKEELPFKHLLGTLNI